MYLHSLKVSNIKNIQNFEYNFDKNIAYFYSPNGTGKTNLLEAIQVLTIGKSLRSISEKDLIPFDKTVKSIDVKGEFIDEDEISFTANYTLLQYPKSSKVLKINGNKITGNEYIGRMPSIWFGPESIKIITSSPLNKRKFFDDILIQLFPVYHDNLRKYKRALKQRNKTLQNENPDKIQIGVWTEQIIRYGAEIIKTRRNFFNKINNRLANIKSIERYNFSIKFNPSIKLNEIFDEDAEYKFRFELQNTYQRDLITQTTSVGPHKDDWEMMINIHPQKDWLSAERFASRGQQRMSLIILLTALINIFEEERNIRPIMLLDDIFSELDSKNEEILLKFIEENKIQTFITGVHKLKNKKIKQINLIEFLNG